MDPQIIPREQHTLSRQHISPDALKVLYRLKEQGFLAYLAGGGVRDLLLGRRPKDFDVVTDATPNEVRRVFRNCRLIGRRFRLAHVLFGDRVVEVATFRSGGESLPDPAIHPAHMLKAEDGRILRDNLFGTPEEDARRRDFTINALFYNIADFSVIDYIGGMADLKAGLIRFIGDARLRCLEDPVRMIRAVRFAAMLNFQMHPETRAAMAELHGHLALANCSRLYEETLKLFLCGRAEAAYTLLRQLGLFGVLFPALDAGLGAPDGTPECRRVRQALRRVDEWRSAGREVRPALLFALLFGGRHESEAARAAEEGHHPLAALHSETIRHFGALAPRVLVPKAVRYEAAEILLIAAQMAHTRGRRAERLAARPLFSEALEYFAFSNECLGRDPQMAALWRALGPREGERPEQASRRRRPRRRGWRRRNPDEHVPAGERLAGVAAP